FRAMKEPAHRALHPFGQIPTYEEGDLALFETGAIVSISPSAMRACCRTMPMPGRARSHARPDRLPMGIMVKRIEAIKERPLAFLWRDVIEHWIIAQHVHWSAVRGGDGKQRLRIGLEGAGWIRVRSRLSTVFHATPDRLATLLSLGSECDLFVRSPDKILH